MAKKTNQEVMPVSPELQKALAVINALKPQVDEIGLKLMQIKVIDENSLAICQQNLSKANSIVKSIEEKRVESKAPVIEAGKLIDGSCKTLTEIAMQGIVHAKTEVANWEKQRLAEAKKLQDEIDAKAKLEADKVLAEDVRKKGITDYISNEMTPWLQSCYSKLTNVFECDVLLDTINTRFPDEKKFQEYYADALQIKSNFIGLIEAKKAQLSVADNISDTEREILKEKADIAEQKQKLAERELAIKQKDEQAEADRKKKEAEELAEQAKKEAQVVADANKTSGIRKLWRHEVVDMEKVPADWKIVDESKVKEYIKTHKDNLVEDYCINGIRFFTEISVVA